MLDERDPSSVSSPELGRSSSDVICGLLQCLEEPCPGEFPFPVHRANGKSRHLGSLFNGQPGEEPELDDFRGPRLQLLKTTQSLVECQDFVRVLPGGELGDIRDRAPTYGSAAFLASLA